MVSERIKTQVVGICDGFVNNVSSMADVSPYEKSRHAISDFPIFEVANREFFEYAYYEKAMEAGLRDSVIKPIVDLLFNEIGMKIEWPNKGRNYVRFSNEAIEKIIPFEFRIKHQGSFIGVRYTGLSEEDPGFTSIMRENGIKKVLVVKWRGKYRLRNDSKVIEEIKAFDFLAKFFGIETADFVIQEVKKAVKRANEEVGFQTIPMLSLRNLSSFKDERRVAFSQFDYKNMNYMVIEESNVVSWKKYSMPQDDLQIIDDVFTANSLYRAFDGRKKFAKSFMTSEYLYGIFKSGNSFDYTAIATGYLKSLEQLVYEIVLAELKLRPSEEVKIKRKSGKLKNYDYVKTIQTPHPKTHAWQVPFLPKNEEYFDTTMAPLIWLLHDYDNIWRISSKGKEVIHEALLKYTQECRNDHFHKDNIDSFQLIECIRNNTILLFYLLLGSCKLSNNMESTKKDYLGIDNDGFSMLCKELYQIPVSQNKFLLKYGDTEIKAIRLYDQQRLIYDSSGSVGNIIIEFVQVDDFREEKKDDFLDSIKDEKRIHLSRDNMPEKIWLVIQDGDQQEVW